VIASIPGYPINYFGFIHTTDGRARGFD
jgi:hypothetical protein